jgi:hypothetical protein
MKHFGKVDEQGLTLFENWLKEERQGGRTVSYVFVEVPGNPTLETPDTHRLKKLVSSLSFIAYALTLLTLSSLKNMASSSSWTTQSVALPT